MQEPRRDQNPKPRAPWLRILALIAALFVLAGTLFAVFQPGKNSDASLLPTAYAAADTEKPWKDLKKGASGGAVRQAQQALAALGYYDGRQDGNFSKAFEEAVLAFQKDWGLEENGVIDRDIFDLLTAELPQPTALPTSAPERTPTPGCVSHLPTQKPIPTPKAASPTPARNGAADVVRGKSYSDKAHVAAYLRAYGELPPNYITKSEAQRLGWVASEGNLWQVAPGKSIGGDRFGNYEGALPSKSGRRYYECDIDSDGGFRNAKRLIYSNDGLIFYTEDHYSTFEEIK